MPVFLNEFMEPILPYLLPHCKNYYPITIKVLNPVTGKNKPSATFVVTEGHVEESPRHGYGEICDMSAVKSWGPAPVDMRIVRDFPEGSDASFFRSMNLKFGFS